MKESRRLLLKGIITAPVAVATLVATNKLGELLYPQTGGVRRLFDFDLSPKSDFRGFWPRDQRQLEHFTVSTYLPPMAIALNQSNLETIAKNYSIPLPSDPNSIHVYIVNQDPKTFNKIVQRDNSIKETITGSYVAFVEPSGKLEAVINIGEYLKSLKDLEKEKGSAYSYKERSDYMSKEFSIDLLRAFLEGANEHNIKTLQYYKDHLTRDSKPLFIGRMGE
ncbi:hypothetical protein HYT02_01980 [Candidatus Gottesmanbacteria bacterium]|nr:hypothetical protein [Candidatus Gottesmanbacteria bacterium]